MKKAKFCLYPLLIIGISFLLFSTCKKEDDIKVITDFDGNIYTSVTIGTQVWMKENLKVTRYRNGDLIETTVPVSLDLSDQITPKYEWTYNGEESNVDTYGRLYTWYAITDSRNICPEGWHVPTDAEWKTLTDYLTSNGYGYGNSGSDIGKSLASTSGWSTIEFSGLVGNDQNSNNRTGFTAFPSGFRSYLGTFNFLGFCGGWWSATEFNTINAWYQTISHNSGDLYEGNIYKKSGLAVRCVKD